MNQQPAYTRKGVNVIAERIYQRGQIMTWSLEEKRAFFKQHNIGMVVNFWSKLDADMSECGVIYVYAPTPHSKDITSINNVVLAEYVSSWLVCNTGEEERGENVLVLCEAGKTRSVFFCVLLVSAFTGVVMNEALKVVTKVIPGHKLKPHMLEYIKEVS